MDNADLTAKIISFLCCADRARTMAVSKFMRRVILTKRDAWNKFLTIGNCDNVDPEYVQRLPLHNVEYVQFYKPNFNVWLGAFKKLKELTIISWPYRSTLTKDCIECISRLQIQNLDISCDVDHLEIDKFQATQIRLRGYVDFRNSSLRCNNELKSLVIDRFVEYIPAASIGLAKLQLSESSMLTRAHFLNACRYKNLKVLIISANIEDDDLVYLPDLRVLSVTYSNFTRKGIEYLSKSKIQALSIYKNLLLKDEDIISLTRSEIKCLRIIDCPKITERCMDTINLLKLSILQLTSLNYDTDKKMHHELKEYTSRCPALKLINDNLVHSIDPAHKDFINLHNDYLYWTVTNILDLPD